MNALKKYWYFILLLLITAGLGIMTFLTSQKLTSTQPVAPTVPQATPKAAEPACTLSFSIAAATNTPTHTPTNTPIDTPTSTPTGTPGNTATPSPTTAPLASCNNTCVINTDCTSGLVCMDGACRNPSCTEQTDCTCTVVEETAAPTPEVPVAGTGPTVLGISVIGGGILLLLLGLAL